MVGSKSETEKYQWQVLALTQMRPIQVFQLFRLRQQVFILEQQCLYEDMDELDITAHHILAFAKEDGIIACARLIGPSEMINVPRIGRFIVAPAYRGRGVACELLERCIKWLNQQYPGLPIDISAQAHLEKFYQSAGFITTSEPYDEDGILHITMRREN